MVEITVAGIDIGSRTTKLVLLENGKLSEFQIIDTGLNPLTRSKELLSAHRFDWIVATGYGRHLARTHFANSVITEIKAHAQGAHFLFPHCKTIIDVGGQDSKVIRIVERALLSECIKR